MTDNGDWKIPENVANARAVVAGLIPLIHDVENYWYLNIISMEARVFSAEEAELAEFLADDDEMNLTSEPMANKRTQKGDNGNPQVVSAVPPTIPGFRHAIKNEEDSVSTFHQQDRSPYVVSTSFTLVILLLKRIQVSHSQ